MSAQPNLGMQVTTFDNPMGIHGFEFVEFAAPAGQGAAMRAYLESLGFTAVAKHAAREITLFRQGTINFLLNESVDSFASDFANKHGPSACGFAIRFTKPTNEVLAHVLANGGEEIAADGAVRAPRIQGIGGCMLYLVDDAREDLYADFAPLPGVDQHPRGFGLTFIDHLTHNLFLGNMQKWSDYYEKLFNFREIRYFDIKGEYTGLQSRAMTAPDGRIRIPLNEEAKLGGGQIEEYLMRFNGEGIQHIALSTDDIHATVEALRGLGVVFQDVPDTYSAQGYTAMYLLAQAIKGLRNLAGHLFLSDGNPMSHEAQFLESVTIVGTPWLHELIFPVGLRYHAIHHLFPAMPYHNMPECHRRFMTQLPADSGYRRTLYRSIWQVFAVLRRNMRQGQPASALRA